LIAATGVDDHRYKTRAVIITAGVLRVPGDRSDDPALVTFPVVFIDRRSQPGFMSDEDGRQNLHWIDEWPGGFSWIADPDERGQRASHALDTEAGVRVVDPVDADGLDDRIAELGDVAGVLVLHDRHRRDASDLARRHGVAVHLAAWMSDVADGIDARIELVEDHIPGTNYAVHRLIDDPDWQEAILYDDAARRLVVPEAVGTLESFRVTDDELGVHPSLDDPPLRLADFGPDRLLVGHGPSVNGDATARLRAALDAVAG